MVAKFYLEDVQREEESCQHKAPPVPYQFIATSRPRYFSRNGDLVFYNSQNFLLKVKPLINEDLIHRRFFVGFVVSRKIGPAVIRNKVKRRLRMIFNSKDLNLNGHFCYILVFKPSVSQISFEELKLQILDGLSFVLSHHRFTKYLETMTNS